MLKYRKRENTANADIRRKLKNANIPIWRAAKVIGIHEKTLVVWLRNELEGEKLRAVNEAVDYLINGDGAA